MTLLADLASDIAGDDVFFDTDSGFAQTVTNVTAGGTFPAIFDNEYSGFDSDGFEVQTTEPVLICRTADVPTRDDILTVNSVNYVTYSIDTNTNGTSVVHIKEQL